MKKTLSSILLLSVLAWLWPVAAEISAWDPWIWRKQLIYLSGFAAFLLMSLGMLLAVRPQWLERPLGGLDKMYRLHKWAGIWALGLAFLHYGLKLAKGPMLSLLGEATREHRLKTFLEIYRSSAKDLGEWSLWLLLVVILLALWRRFPYHLWRYTHKAVALLYLLIVYHSVVLAPPQWWLQPAGVLLAVAAAVGSICALLSLSGQIGRSKRWQGEVIACTPLSDNCFELICQLPRQWRHQAGQFAFLRVAGFDEAHPFTIASADHGDGRLRFAIKALGDDTERMATQIRPGQQLEIEGPYGDFLLPVRESARERTRTQLWIAGGIGITPFIAWLEKLQRKPAQAPEARLYYCVNNQHEAVFAKYLQALCAKLPSIELHLHHSEQQGYLQASEVLNGPEPVTDIWFCGPQALSAALARQAREMGMNDLRIHQEAFQMR